ncbi:MAG: SulP family inorganic anion transporter [Ferruginibacter sp.]
MFRPKIFDTLKNYTREQFGKDLLAGLIVGIVALPLAIAFAIASGVSPEKGLFTAVIAGFIISALGGSKVQIGGPTGAFIVIVYGIVQVYGVNGLIIATLMAGIMLIIMGFARLGSIIKFIPHPLIVGFTSGIALIIFSSQMKDFFGLQMGSVPADFISKWQSYFLSFSSFSVTATFIGIVTMIILLAWPYVTHKIPGSLIAIIVTTAAVQIFHLPAETIGSRFGNIQLSFPMLSIPHVDFETIRHLVQPAFTIALLCAIESLLSAVVADSMIGSSHRSNMELVAQGTANIFSALFGGIPATGAIARTATNVKNGGRTPVAGIVHSIVLLIIILFTGKWAALIPMATLAGILVVVAYHMSEWQSFISLVKGPRTDVAVLLITFLLTVIVDLTVAIEIGMILAAFLFMRNMTKSSNVNILTNEMNNEERDEDNEPMSNYSIPAGVEVFEINGPLFFGAAYKFKDAMKFIEKTPRILIVRMRRVPIIDATGIRMLADLNRETRSAGTKLILSEVGSEQVTQELKKSRLLFAIGKGNVLATFAQALKRSRTVLTGN